MTIIAQGMSYIDRSNNREYLVVDMPHKRTIWNALLCRNTLMVSVKEYPLSTRGIKTKTFPLSQMARWGLLDIPESAKMQHRRKGYTFAKDNTELNKKLTRNGQKHYLK